MHAMYALLSKELRAVQALPWRRFPAALESFPIYLASVAVASMIYSVVFASFIPALFIAHDPRHVLGYFLAAQLLVQLAWVIVGWFAAVTAGAIVVAVLAERPLIGAVPALGASLARIATWTGRLAMPVLLGSVVAWVFPSPTGALGQFEDGSILRQLAILQVGMLLLTLTIVVAVEGVGVLFRSSEGLPWSLRTLISVGFPLAGWTIARRICLQYPTDERVFTSIAPTTFGGWDRAEVIQGARGSYLHVPFVAGAITAILILTVLILSDRISRRNRSQADSKAA